MSIEDVRLMLTGFKEVKTLLYILIGICAVTVILNIWNLIKKK